LIRNKDRLSQIAESGVNRGFTGVPLLGINKKRVIDTVLLNKESHLCFL